MKLIYIVTFFCFYGYSFGQNTNGPEIKDTINRQFILNLLGTHINENHQQLKDKGFNFYESKNIGESLFILTFTNIQKDNLTFTFTSQDSIILAINYITIKSPLDLLLYFKYKNYKINFETLGPQVAYNLIANDIEVIVIENPDFEFTSINVSLNPLYEFIKNATDPQRKRSIKWDSLLKCFELKNSQNKNVIDGLKKFNSKLKNVEIINIPKCIDNPEYEKINSYLENCYLNDKEYTKKYKDLLSNIYLQKHKDQPLELRAIQRVFENYVIILDKKLELYAFSYFNKYIN